MSYKPISLHNLINQKNRTLFLPHIQRPFVWDYDQIIRLLDSLMKNYPIQTLLLWKTRDQIKTRKFMDNVIEDPDLSDYYDNNISQNGREKTFVLDGQQRLQSLFAVFDGTIDGKNLYIDILTGTKENDDGLHYNFKLSNEELKLPFFKIKNLVSDNRNAEDISDEINDKINSLQPLNDSNSNRERERTIRRNIAQLVSLLREDKHFWYDELDGIANNYPYTTILNIFIRVNSGGTKLDAADLMFAAMKEAWESVEENIEDIVDMLNNSGRLNFDKSFVLKCAMLVIDKGAVLDPKLFIGEEGEKNLTVIENNWPRILDAFLQLKDLIQNDLKLYSDKVIRSYNAFIPIFEYLYYYPSPEPINRSYLISYHYKAQLFNWFSARTDQLLNSIHTIIKKGDIQFPVKDISSYFQGQNKDTLLLKSHLDDFRVRYILLNLLYSCTHNTSPFNVMYKQNVPHIDHIYPKSKLKSLPKGDVNHIGNYRFVGASDNIKKRAELPESYFLRLSNAGIDTYPHLLVNEYSSDPTKLTLGNYFDFRNKRIDSIFKICDNIINK